MDFDLMDEGEFDAESYFIEVAAAYPNASISPSPIVLRDSGSNIPKRDNIILVKSLNFAVAAGFVALKLCKQRHTYPIGDQLLRCSASVGANCEEANGASSPKDFAAKMSIALKEAREARYWIRYAYRLEVITIQEKDRLFGPSDELVRIIASIVSTTRRRHIKK